MKTLMMMISLVLGQADAAELTLYVIKPRLEMDWSSPRTLAVTSGLNSAGHDYAPIGHFAVELSCARPNRYGISHVLTGMERKDKVASRRITLREGLGLGSLTYAFEGQLQSASQSRAEILKARADHRLKIVRIPTSEARCDQMMEFLSAWIDAGSYTVYGGGKDVAAGEGAGCADFAMEFLRLATGDEPPRAWMARVSIPSDLVGGGGKKVSMLKLLGRGEWASSQESHRDFEIADTDLAHRWLDSHIGRRVEYQMRNEAAATPPEPLPTFKYHYRTTGSPNELWRSIEL